MRRSIVIDSLALARVRNCATADGDGQLESPPKNMGNAIDLGGGSRYVAASAGRVALVHPPGVVPSIGAGVEFIPTVVEGDDAETSYPGCGVVEAAASAPETDR